MAETKQPVSASNAFFFVAACMAATYFLIGLTDYGYALLGMLTIILLLALPGKVNRNTAKVMSVIITIAGIGSTFMIGAGLKGEALALRSITFILFVITTLSAIGFILKLLLGIVGMVAFVGLIGYVMSGNDTAQNGKPEQLDFGPEEDKTAEERPQDMLRTHLRKWKDYKSNAHEGPLEIWTGDAKESHQNRVGMKINAQTTSEYWGNVYRKLVNHDSPHMTRIIDMFSTLGSDKQMNQVEQANAIVSCIQQIPYVLIYKGDCANIPQEAPQLMEVIKNNPCKGGVEYGLQGPSEFMYDLKGDCDTRTVLLFTILGKLGYKVCILNSEQYGHSMLGVELPASGTYKSFRGSRYYFWETTAPNWELGVLPPEMNQVQYWEVVLSN